VVQDARILSGVMVLSVFYVGAHQVVRMQIDLGPVRGGPPANAF
jgi:hypothetical protein